MDFRAGMATAAHGNLHLSEASLSGQGQEEKNGCGKQSEKQLTFFLYCPVINYVVWLMYWW
jgi:hypothetical protein